MKSLHRRSYSILSVILVAFLCIFSTSVLNCTSIALAQVPLQQQFTTTHLVLSCLPDHTQGVCFEFHCNMIPNSCQPRLQDLSPKIQLPVLEFSIMKTWFNFPLMDYCAFICTGARMPRFMPSVIFMRSVWRSSLSLWYLTAQRSLASSENSIFSLHLT